MGTPRWKGDDILEASLMLCDCAQVVDGKLYILGGGWDRTRVGNPAIGIAMEVLVEWTETNQKHTFEIELQSEDGDPVLVGDPPGPLKISGEFATGRPVQHPPGMPLGVRQALNIQNVPLEPSSRYRWELRIDGHPETWVRFYTE